MLNREINLTIALGLLKSSQNVLLSNNVQYNMAIMFYYDMITPPVAPVAVHILGMYLFLSGATDSLDCSSHIEEAHFVFLISRPDHSR